MCGLLNKSTDRDFSGFFSGNIYYEISMCGLLNKSTDRDFSEFFQEIYTTKFLCVDF